MFKRISIFFIILIFFTGCIKSYPDYYKLKYVLSTKITDFRTPTENLLLKMHDKIVYITPKIKNKYVYVVDFVNVRNLDVSSQLGFFLSSELKTHITHNFNFNIKEIEYMKYFKLGENGSKLLSRNKDEINLDEVNKTYAFVGTYAITQRQLIMYLKLIDMKTGNILSSTSERIELTDEIINLERESKRNINFRPHLVL